MRRRVSCVAFVVSVLAFVGGLAAAVVGCLAQPVLAHASFVRSEPAADATTARQPRTVTVTFNEPVEIAFGALRVYDSDAERVDEGDASHPPGVPASVRVGLQDGLEEGTYTATYRVISADSHPVDGAFVFHVGRPGARPQGVADVLEGAAGAGYVESIVFTVVRWVNFAGLLVGAGAWFFATTIWRRRGSGADDAAFTARWRRIMRSSFLAVVVATLAGAVLQGSTAADVPLMEAIAPEVLRELARTRYGSIAIVKLVVLVLAAVMWFATRPRPPRVGTSHVVIGSVVALVLLATPGLHGHPVTASPIALNVVADIVHVACAAVWIGGLVALAGAAYPAVGDASAPLEALRPVVVRYSDAAMVAVAGVVVSGVVRSWVEVGALRGFITDPFGWVLLGKIGTFVPLIALGVVNNRVLKPRITRTGDDASQALTSLRRTVRAEIAIAVVVVALTAVLVNLSPVRGEAGASGPFIADVELGSDELNVIVDPGRVGENIIHLTVTRPDGRPAEIEAMEVALALPSADIGPIVVGGRRISVGHYVVQGRQLSVAGQWRLQVTATYDRFTDRRAAVTVPVAK